jgi:glucose-6-phosphate isomerase
MSELTNSAAWQALQRHAGQLRGKTLLKLFDDEPLRAERYCAEAAGLYLDYSKQRVNRETLELLHAFAESRRVTRAIGRMFAGEPVNVTEKRPALHVALRNVAGRPMMAGGHSVAGDVQAVLARMEAFTEGVRSGAWRGWSGEAITDVVNVGIGGSDLGPRFVCDALAAYAGGVRTHFISNVDGGPLADLLAQLKPQSTIFIVTSKTFHTPETEANARTARTWLQAAGGMAAVQRHFLAVTANAEAARQFGVPAEQTFEFWDWVGGRYSLWSAVGIAILFSIGPQRFAELRSGAHAMDEHFRLAEPARNLPVILGLLGVWNTNFLGHVSHVMAPYAQRLRHFTPWLQQLEMESNGKSVDVDGKPVDYATTPVLWGDVGTNTQHAYFQMLHQGTTIHPVDFVLVQEPGHALAEQHRMLLANGLAQAAAMLRGKGEARVCQELQGTVSDTDMPAAVAARVYPGNRPSNTLLVPRLDPYHLGALLALYEHRAYVQGVLWNINSFDQFGVQLGKQAAERVLAAMVDGDFGPGEKRLDPSTRRLISRINGVKK